MTAITPTEAPIVRAGPERPPRRTLPAQPAHHAEPAEQWIIRNETPRLIWIEHDCRLLALAPLEERDWSPAPGTDQPGDLRAAFPALRRLEDRRQVTLCPKTALPGIDAQVSAALRRMTILGCGWLATLWPLTLWWWLRTGAILALGCGLWLVVLLIDPARRERRRSAFRARAMARQVRRRTWYNFTMVMVVAVGILIPATALYLATDLREVVTFWPGGVAVRTDRPLVLIGRLMQLTFIAVATLMPALMYFQFDAERLVTLRRRWIQNVFRLDPTVATMSDVKAKYDRQLEEAYGLDAGRGRLARGRRSPIIVTTLILAFGWLLIMLRAGERIDEGPAGTLSFLELLSPDQSLVTFAFLGAYFFGLHLVWQGYVRADLRPKTYTTIAVRILIVVVLAWLIEAVIDHPAEDSRPLYLLAFVAGFVPDKVLHLLWEKVVSRAPDIVFDDRQQPLTRIEGMDLYERTRLSEEGITNVEALAHHDLLDLFFKTRFPAARLVDWVDQAILVMYLNSDVMDRSGSRLRAALRTLGVRTASDLVMLINRSRSQQCDTSHAGCTELTVTLRGQLPEEECVDIERRLHLLRETLDQSEWMGRIVNWRRNDLIEARPERRRYIDETGELRKGDPRLT